MLQFYTDPWPHQIVDEFFEASDFEKISIACLKLQDHYKDQIVTADSCSSFAEVYDIIGEEVFEIILKSNRKLLDNIEQYPINKVFEQYVSFPTFHILPPNVPPQKVHDEALDKSISVVVYLYPTNSVGTALFKTQSRESFVKEVEWKPNRAMSFCGQENVTWHDFYSREEPRITLNYFVRRLISTDVAEQDGKYFLTGMEGPKTFMPKELVSRLTTGILFRL
jgi:hypothetical protein